MRLYPNRFNRRLLKDLMAREERKKHIFPLNELATFSRLLDPRHKRLRSNILSLPLKSAE